EHAATEVTNAFVEATRAEMNGDDKKALDLHARVVSDALGVHSDAHRVAAILASLDAVAEGGASALEDATTHMAILDRRTDGAQTLAALATAYGNGSDPFGKGLIANTLAERAAEAGDAQAAERWRVATGCARDVTVIGPVDWARVAAVREGGPLEKFDAPIEAMYTLPGPFAEKLPPVVVKGRTCVHSTSVFGTHSGVRDVAVDVDVKDEQDIGVLLQADRAATLRVGGKVAIDRPSELGTGDVQRFARVHVGKGRVRVVARVGNGDFEIAVLGEKGDPLPMHAPNVGDRGNAAATTVKGASPSDLPKATNDAERTLYAAAALASGDSHGAERLLADRAKEDSAPPELLLLYARALDVVRDLDAIHRAERARSIDDRILEKAPNAWEATLEHAKLAAVRKGASEAKLEAIRDLDEQRKKGKAAQSPLLDAFEAALAGREGLHDRAQAALERARKALAGTAMFRDVERSAAQRSQEERVAFECATVPGAQRASLQCYYALRDTGKLDAALAELDRVRKLRGAPNAYAAFILRDALAKGDMALARTAYDELLPGERSLSAMRALEGTKDPSALRAKLLGAAPDASDSPGSLPALLLTLGDDPATEFDGIGARLAAEDRKSPKLASAATAILAHTERYDVSPDGLVRYVFFDVRRVSGTTDIEENAAARAPDLLGRTTMRVLRRRIHKRDGRVLEPDRTPGAAQSHAELAQLEQGDVVEALYEGLAIPTDTGDIGIDTPDLLPERTAVARADIELRLPTSLKAPLWVHPILGKPTETTVGNQRVLKWSLVDHNARRLEEGVPRTEREVGLVMGTITWSTVSRALRETLVALQDRDEEVAKWAQAAAANHPAKSRELVEAVVARAGDTVREASGALIADFGFGLGRAAATTTARTILVDHEGSRTWLIARALDDLGIPVDIGVAESEPYSADPNYPANMSRFSHPLAVAHVGKDDVWIDADVSGPPLPAGRISPELRGRAVLFADGSMKPAPSGSLEKERDEVDLRVVVDDKGDAKGELTVLLRGRAAQQISEALFRLVGFEREKALFGIALGWVPFANVDKVALSSSEGSWQIALRAEISVPGYAQPAEQDKTKTKVWLLPGLEPIHYVFPRSSVSTVAATYAGQSARESALSIRSAVQYHVHRRVELPKGASVVKSPGPADVRSANLEGKRAITVNQNVVEDTFELAVTTGTVAPDKYGEFVDSARKVDDSFLASTRIKLQ
ncbi:MAG TPA: hypothetical protein VH054_01330, partial [Polyangiaceae bacterium]|nr:hypothetical protein [Polyangiaceae bacterium]